MTTALVHRSLSQRLRICGLVGLGIGIFYSVAAMFYQFSSKGQMNRVGDLPTLSDTFAPVLGGLCMGLLVGALWPARARKDTSIAAGIIAGLPMGLTIMVSMFGRANLNSSNLIGAALVGVVFGVPLGAFIYDYDR